MKEIWAELEYHKGYFISNYGLIRGIKGSIRKPYQKRYSLITIERKTYSVHRLVARYFIPNPQNKPCVNHIDGNKNNNHFSNLEWVTHSENSVHAMNTGLMPSIGKENNQAKTIFQYSLDGKLIRTYGSSAEIVEFGFNRGSLHNYFMKKQKQYKGYVWKYE